MELTAIRDALLSVRIYAEVRPPSAEHPLPHIMALLDDEETGDYILEMSYLPGVEGELESSRLLQFFVPLFEPSPKSLDETERLVSFLNQTAPLPGFVLDRSLALVFFRYTLPVSSDETIESIPVVLDTIFLLFYLIALYAEPLEQVIRGEKTFDEVIEPIPAE